MAGDKGYAVLARELREAGLETLFGVMGEANLDLVACLTVHHGATYVSARHEAGAVAMADGYARSSGRIGFATVTCGPGLTNALTPLISAVRARAEILLITGQLPLEASSRSQTIDHGALLAPTGAGIVHVASAAELSGAVTRAMRLIRATHAPVVLNVLIPVLDGEADPVAGNTPERTQNALTRTESASDNLGQTIAALSRAERPILLAGRGAVEAGAGPALRRLSDRLGAGLATSLLAHGLFAGHERDLGVAGGLSSPGTQAALEAADVIAVFGASLNGWTTRAGTAGRAATVVQVDTDVNASSRSTLPVAISVIGDVAEVTERLHAALPSRPASPWLGRAVVIGELDRETERLDPRAFCRALDRMLPRERTVTVDAGQFFEFPTRFMGVPDERGYLFTISFGTVGLGLATAAGAAFGRPDRLSVAFVGDGGLMMSLTELDTVARARRPMLIVVINDGGYGAEVKHLDDRGWNADLAHFPNPAFAEVARSLGIRGYTVERLSDLAALADELAVLDGPVLIDAKVDPAIRAEWMAVMHAARR